MKIRPGLLAALLFGSGLSALVYQSVWQASFRVVFGATGAASATVLGIFLGAMGVGAWLLGRRFDSHPRPLLIYGRLELGISFLAALTPHLIEGTAAIYAMTGGTMKLGTWGATLVRVPLATLVIGAPAFLMGATLPAAAQVAVVDNDRARTGLARIYSFNTLGAVLGALIGPLYLFRTVGIHHTLYAAVSLNVVVGGLAWTLSRKYEDHRLHSAQTPLPSENRFDDDPSMASDKGKSFVSPRLVYGIATLLGFCFLAMELVWFRMLAPILGGSSITFGLILAIALLGIGLGSLVYSWWAQNRPAGTRSAITTRPIIWTLILEALFIAIPFAWGENLALVTAHLRTMGNLGEFGLVGGWSVIAAVVVFPVALISGFQFPFLLALLGQGPRYIAQQVGRAYAFNTLGTIVGSLVGGLLMIPLFGATTTWRIVSLSLLITSLSLAGLHARDSFIRLSHWLALAALTLLSIGLISASGPGKIWRHTPIGAGRVHISNLTKNGLRDRIHATYNSILFEEEGVESSLAVDIDGGIAFLVNGKSDGSVVGDRGTQIMLALIPAALHPNPHNAFVVGLGTGTTGGMLGLLSGIKEVDVAEIEPAVKKVALLSTLANGDILNNPKVRIHTGDARELLLSSSRKYDIIVSEPSNPYRMGVASLFTQEFYQIANSRLADGGILSQWVQGYEIDAATLSTVLQTLRSVFSHVSIWNSGEGDFVVLASQTPQLMQASLLRARLAEEPFKTWFIRSRFVEGPEAFAAQQLLPAKNINLLHDNVPGEINTDDLNLLEHSFAKSMGSGSALSDQLRRVVLEFQITPDITGDFDKHKLLDARTRLMPQLDWPQDSNNRWVSQGCQQGGTLAAADQAKASSSGDPVEDWIRGFNLAVQGKTVALEFGKNLRTRGFHAEAHLIEAQLNFTELKIGLAAAHLTQALNNLRAHALPLCEAPQKALNLCLQLGRSNSRIAQEIFDSLAEESFAVFIVESERRDTLLALAQMSERGGNIDYFRCTQALAVWEPFPKWTKNSLMLREYCYRKTQHVLMHQAAEDLTRFYKAEPSRYESSHMQIVSHSGNYERPNPASGRGPVRP